MLDMNQYDLNRQQMANCNPIPLPLLTQETGNVAGWFGSNDEFKYFMLLCRERNDYTIFNVIEHNYSEAALGLFECLTFRGQTLAIDYNHDAQYYEIWVKCFDEELPSMYVLFPCNDFVIEC